MRIIKERSRIRFFDYNDNDKKKIEDMVATMDKVFTYEDVDNHYIALPTGMLDPIKKTFPDVQIDDRSETYWEFDNTAPYEFEAEPRNQLQKDCIELILKDFNDHVNCAAILSPGQGKLQSVNTMIPISDTEFKRFGDLKEGDFVLGSDGNPTKVLKIFPQGIQDIYIITLEDGRKTNCSLEHLWLVKKKGYNEYYKLELKDFINDFHKYQIPVKNKDDLSEPYKFIDIKSIEYYKKEDSQCILVENEDHLYITEDFIVTHNTFIACYCALKTRMKTLIIVPTKSIKVQWADTLTGMFKVPEEKVKMIDSPKEFINVKADFVVVSHATLSILNKTYDLQKIMKANRFGVKIIDEVQMWFHNIIKVDGNSNIANNLYLTGTFGRSSEEENDIYQQMFGYIDMFTEKEKKPTLFNPKPGNVYGMKPHMHITMVWTNSKLTQEEIASCTNSMRYSERSGKWMRYGISVPQYIKLVIPPDGTMTKFLDTVLKVIKLAEFEVRYGKTLILTPTIESVNILVGHVEKMFPNKKIGTYNSTNSSQKNEENKNNADILISTEKSCGTGFDFKDLAKLIVVSPYASWILTDQISGRLRRRPDGKDTYMWDIADNSIKQLRVWANKRAEIEKKKAKRFKVIDM